MKYHRHMSSEQLRQVVEQLPRVKLAHLPTPLQECPRLTKELSPAETGPTFYIKRDDMTGLGMGGNKFRHLEFRLGDALSRGCDTYVYMDDANAGRATAAACARVGMRFIQVVPSDRPRNVQTNLFLSRIFGAELHYVEPGDDPRTKAHEKAAILERELRKTGRRPYRIQAMPWFNQSAVISYLLAALELEAQFQDRGIGKAHIFIVAGHSQAGLQLAAKLLGLDWAVTGVAVGQAFETEQPMADWSREVAELLVLPTYLDSDDISVVFDFAAPGFHRPSEASRKAVELAGRTEGVALDPMYTGKAMAAMIDCVRSGTVEPDTAVAFIHTGGLPMLFDSKEMFE